MRKASSPQQPEQISAASFAVIRRTLQAAGVRLPPEQAPIVERIIHATADFEFAHITRFSAGAVAAGVAALQQGAPIVCDVNMVRVGLDMRRLRDLGGAAYCFVHEATTAERARCEGITRSAAGVRIAAEQGLLDGGVLVVGNAPTALFEALHLLDTERIRPALIVGVPVGFINTVESKAALMHRHDVAWIATAGRKGGSPVAVAIVNALLRLALGDAPHT
ncbi:precorrin-8X/cobalt-precorrin-8 methylmutase [Ardenticatena maritima]|uniref:Precorrin-8X methylmutase n=1 Tax=Ardenticatena maritima TaxID=872965 RepID=A0A0M8KAF1_9CHLR|nr:precorrin-8X methylmutase [Ardenticatena maritima]KPL87584.1 precorrin-8X methylmutase [Ardenticatena maritima]GAP63586.1 precorrin-8X/cobalt-precorrin-8 methylmutase [Ardenticatena maritima]